MGNTSETVELLHRVEISEVSERVKSLLYMQIGQPSENPEVLVAMRGRFK